MLRVHAQPVQLGRQALQALSTSAHVASFILLLSAFVSAHVTI